MELRQYSLNNKGFTLVELLITIGVFSILVAAGTSALTASRRQSEINAQAQTLTQLVRETQQRSLTAINGSAWGIRCETTEIIRFSYASSDPTTELTSERVALSPHFSCVTAEPIKFNKLSGFIGAPADLQLLYRGTAEKQIEVRSPGVITLVQL